MQRFSYTDYAKFAECNLNLHEIMQKLTFFSVFDLVMTIACLPVSCSPCIISSGNVCFFNDRINRTLRMAIRMHGIITTVNACTNVQIEIIGCLIIWNCLRWLYSSAMLFSRTNYKAPHSYKIPKRFYCETNLRIFEEVTQGLASFT